ncbi:MAG: hypothetical protein IT365_20985 [Candidatus Hydrogenedentes bacterium]|nr:hypothetical protein [Candidatus Hydrogenedentota bacterium]
MHTPISGSPARERYDWLDQARGLIVLMLIISMSTYYYSGDVLSEDIPLGPTMLNHGYQYFSGVPPLITPIDVGQGIFMFVMGFVGYNAFTRRRQLRGARSAFLYTVRRVGVLYALAFFECIVMHYVLFGETLWRDFFIGSTFTLLALGALAGFTTIALLPNADRRIRFAAVLTVIHSLLYASPYFDHYTGDDNIFHLMSIPFTVLGLCTVAIAGTCFGQWLHMDPDNPTVGFQKRIVPVTAAALVAAYSMDWVQPPEPHDATAAHQLLAVGMAGLMLVGFFASGQNKLRFPLLSAMGKNLLVMFLLAGFFLEIYFDWIPKEFLVRWPVAALFLIGILPLAAVSCVAVLLDRLGIIVRA